MGKSYDFSSAPLEVRNLAERYRQVLNQMRSLDGRAPDWEGLVVVSRSLARELDARGVDSFALLHDRHWAQHPVVGASVSVTKGG